MTTPNLTPHHKFFLYGLCQQIVMPTIVYTHLILTPNPIYRKLELQQWKICRFNQYLLDQQTQPGLIYFLFPINPA